MMSMILQGRVEGERNRGRPHFFERELGHGSFVMQHMVFSPEDIKKSSDKLKLNQEKKLS